MNVVTRMSPVLQAKAADWHFTHHAEHGQRFRQVFGAFTVFGEGQRGFASRRGHLRRLRGRNQSVFGQRPPFRMVTLLTRLAVVDFALFAQRHGRLSRFGLAQLATRTRRRRRRRQLSSGCGGTGGEVTTNDVGQGGIPRQLMRSARVVEERRLAAGGAAKNFGDVFSSKGSRFAEDSKSINLNDLP